ncbi:YppG family protein [Metabacillus fastidiosus]|uniref:YppG family protein n=1 Tax=Metabacillus fastidiosus TaxID=1458 RepID=UPI00082525C2|nr:YppG family protein [Metabacillus fastidiosus]MED4462833.1 YppG family protein [Metabacillus fastidiosus]
MHPYLRYEPYPYYKRPVVQNGYMPYFGNNFGQPYHPYEQYQPINAAYQPYSSGTGQMDFPYANPYPKRPHVAKQQPSGIQTVMSQFKKKDGQYDINKMMDTAGQVMSAANQMGSLFKGVTSMFKR